MSTKLEAIAGFLAGREADPRLLDELADPSSEASRFLEATRNRSKSLIVEPIVDREPAPRFRRSIGLRLVPWLAAILGLSVVGWVVDRRFRSIEASMTRSAAESKSAALRLEAAIDRLVDSPTPPPAIDPMVTAFGRVEAGMTRLEQRVQTLGRTPEPTATDRRIGELRDDLVVLRREFKEAEKSQAKKSEELHAANLEVARVLRLILGPDASDRA